MQEKRKHKFLAARRKILPPFLLGPGQTTRICLGNNAGAHYSPSLGSTPRAAHKISQSAKVLIFPVPDLLFLLSAVLFSSFRKSPIKNRPLP
jgi:hypothetical protein